MKLSAIGVVEVSFFANGVYVLDQMLKTSDIQVNGFYTKLGGMMVHILITGKLSAVNAAIESAKQCHTAIGDSALKIAVCIGNPHPEIIKQFNLITK